MLYDIVKELHPRASVQAAAAVARGVALRAQLLKLSPAAFDCENGRDALTAIAYAASLHELQTLAHSNAFVLGARWARIVTIVMMKLPPGTTNAIASTRRDTTWPPKLLDGWIPK